MSDSFTDDHDSFEREDDRDWDDFWGSAEFDPAPSRPRPNDRAMAMVIPGVTLKGAAIKKDDFSDDIDNYDKDEPWLEFDLDGCLPVPGSQLTIGVRTLSRLNKKRRERYLDGEVGHKDAPECSGTRSRMKALKLRRKITN